MTTIIFTIFLVFIIISLFGYIGHWSLHQPWMGKFNKFHLTHHLELYPPSNYLSDNVYRGTGTDNTLKVFAIISIPVILIPITLCAMGLLSIGLTVIILFEMLIIGWLHDYLHDSFHIRNHFLTRMPLIKKIFNKWVYLHYIHHIQMEKNYGIFSFHWDKFFRTYKNELNLYGSYK